MLTPNNQYDIINECTMKLLWSFSYFSAGKTGNLIKTITTTQNQNRSLLIKPTNKIIVLLLFPVAITEESDLQK